MPSVLYSADVVCPMSRPPLRGGGVLVADDRVVAVGAQPPASHDPAGAGRR